MRKEVPQLDNSLTNDELLQLIVDSFQSVVFGTVDQNGDPHTNVADIEVRDDDRLIFSTTYQKAFYNRLKNHPRISITALKGNETLDSVGFTLDGIAEEVDEKYLDQIFAARPEMQQISANHSERRSILRPFAITPLVGSIYDLRQQPIFQKGFKF
ncbi:MULTISPECIES: pyridoxamine 5'-phosphate oxidase family protein [Lactobacillus]|uniref:Pyridoxamine 5'-phosphate oxidase family protein n=1 Tax=Lactobacillus xujianguonis TaxID=2495899 RepID=A0A437SUD5_9LACO|nr:MULTISPECIES: pyridoxamine 5'-phosphate oxidase family protein [Lactobacillus]RVU70490.1 pyridoxamine 5'-phosphate oxidase family protein [Lactobacillus xujianguonis]RVU76840.1 pyridoxamine 5'-phosphate oxidase family protein [Lactobacillus xujianguonis]